MNLPALRFAQPRCQRSLSHDDLLLPLGSVGQSEHGVPILLLFRDGVPLEPPTHCILFRQWNVNGVDLRLGSEIVNVVIKWFSLESVWLQLKIGD